MRTKLAVVVMPPSITRGEPLSTSNWSAGVYVAFSANAERPPVSGLAGGS